jgi:hypothetical protein
MAKRENSNYTKTVNIFNDLEGYLNFCRTFGYKYDEADLYNQRSFSYRQYQKLLSGKEPKDMWEQDSKSI